MQNYWVEKWTKMDKPLGPTRFAKRMVSFFPKSAKVLDLGCGSGRDAVWFAKKGYDITGVDIAQTALDQLIKRDSDVNVICSSIENFTISEKFDVVYANLSLHYFDDKKTREVFSRLRGFLKPCGLLVVRCKSVDDFLFGKGKLLEENYYDDGGHLRHFFTKEYMVEMLTEYSVVKLRKNSSLHESLANGRSKSCFIEAVALVKD